MDFCTSHKSISLQLLLIFLSQILLSCLLPSISKTFTILVQASIHSFWATTLAWQVLKFHFCSQKSILHRKYRKIFFFFFLMKILLSSPPKILTKTFCCCMYNSQSGLDEKALLFLIFASSLASFRPYDAMILTCQVFSMWPVFHY